MDSTTNTEDSQYTNLDLDTAEEILVAAGRPELAKALRFQAQGVRNLVQGEWGKAFVSTVETVMRKEIGALSQRIENSDRARLDRNAQFQKELQERLDGHARVLDEDVKRLAASVEEAAILGGKAYALAGEAVAGVEALAGVVSDQGEEIKAISERVGIVEATPGTYPDLLQGMKHLERMVRQNSERSDRRQMYLLIAIGSIILLFVVLVALQIAAG